MSYFSWQYKIAFIFYEANFTPSGKEMVTWMQVDKPVYPVYIQIIKLTLCT